VKSSGWALGSCDVAGGGRQLPPPNNRLSENLLKAGKSLSKNAKFRAKNPNLEKNSGRIKILSTDNFGF